MSQIDLHIHTCFSSDADYTTEVLLAMAKEKNMKVISFADHNTAGSYSTLPSYTVDGIQIIPGIELDCTIDDVNLHVLGYGIDPKLKIFDEIYQSILNQEQKAAARRIQLVQELGIVVDEKKVMAMAPHGEVPGELIAEVALADPANEGNERLVPYRSGGTRSDNPYVNFYWDYCAKGAPAYVPIEFITLQQAVTIIHEAKGIAVLAHPGNNIHEDEALLDKIMQGGVEGIEVYSSYHSLEQIEFYHQKAKGYDCLITCGSDFHGKNKPSIEIGCPTTKESLEMLTNKLLEKIGC